MSKGIARGSFLACPKTYELRLPTFLIGIASFQDGYLISGGFLGSPGPGVRLPDGVSWLADFLG